MAAPRKFEPEPEEPLAEERRRLARELHDTVGQSLTAVYLNAKYLERKLEERGSEISGDVFELSESIHRTAQELHGIMSRLLAGGNDARDPAGDRPDPEPK